MATGESLRDDSLLDDPSVPDDFEEIVRKSVYPSLKEMPREERRAQRISYIMGMLPRGVKMTREQVEDFVDSQYG